MRRQLDIATVGSAQNGIYIIDTPTNRPLRRRLKSGREGDYRRVHKISDIQRWGIGISLTFIGYEERDRITVIVIERAVEIDNGHSTDQEQCICARWASYTSRQYFYIIITNNINRHEKPPWFREPSRQRRPGLQSQNVSAGLRPVDLVLICHGRITPLLNGSNVSCLALVSNQEVA